MAKDKDKRTPKEATALFERIIKASVAGNPKPKKIKKRGVAPIKKILDPDFLSESWVPPGPDLTTRRTMKKWLEEAFGEKIKGNYKVHFDNGFIYTAMLINGQEKTMTQSEFWAWSKKRAKEVVDKVQAKRQIKK